MGGGSSKCDKSSAPPHRDSVASHSTGSSIPDDARRASTSAQPTAAERPLEFVSSSPPADLDPAVVQAVEHGRVDELQRLPPAQRRWAAAKVFPMIATHLTEGDAMAGFDLLRPMTHCGVLTYRDIRVLVEGGFLKKVPSGAMRAVGPGGETGREEAGIVRPLLELYRMCPPARKALRDEMGGLLTDALWNTPPLPRAILVGLRFFSPIVSGLHDGVDKEYEQLLLRKMMPLYGCDEMLNDSTCMLSVYSAPLVHCVRGILRRLLPERHVAVTTEVFSSLLGCWCASRSKHCVLVMEAFECIINEMDGAVFDAIYKPLFKKVAECAASENEALSLVALRLWDQEAFSVFLTRRQQEAFHALVPALLRNLSLHWSSPVNSALLSAIDLLLSLSKETFFQYAVQYVTRFGGCPDEARGKVERYIDQLREQVAVAQCKNVQLAAVKQEREQQERQPLKVNSHLHFVFGKVLGEGAYSVVKYCKCIEQNVEQSLWREYAAKVVRKGGVCSEEQITQEVTALRSVNHPGVSPLFATFEDARNIYVILEYCPRDMFTCLADGCVTVEWGAFAMAEVAVVLNVLHTTQGMYYGDLKPENILVSDKGHIRLCDFGACKTAQQIEVINKERSETRDLKRTFTGTADYLPPEAISGGEIGIFSDWWSYGVVLYQVLCGYLPFTGDTERDLFRNICSASPKFPATIPAPAIPLLTGLLAPHRTRCTFAKVRSSPFFAMWDFDKIFDTTPPPLQPARKGPMADSRYMQRKYSMVWRPPERQDIGEDIEVIVQERPGETSWDCEPKVADAPHKSRSSMVGVARAGTRLEDYMTSALVPVPHRRRRSSRGRCRSSVTSDTFDDEGSGVG